MEDGIGMARITTTTTTTKCDDCHAEIHPELTVFADGADLCDRCADKRKWIEQKRRISKTVKPKYVIVGDKAFFKCIDPECGLMIEDNFYVPDSDYRQKNLYAEGKMYEHIRQVHKLIWLRAGKTAGWYTLFKFQSRPEVEEENRQTDLSFLPFSIESSGFKFIKAPL